MRCILSTAAVVFIIVGKTCDAFTTSLVTKKKYGISLNLSNGQDDDRRAFLSKVASVATGLTFLPTQSAMAFGDALKKINAKLITYGLPQIRDVPGGFSPLLELYGKGKNRVPFLVEFLYPSEWVLQLPNNDVNGEEGTIQAGQYQAGDTAVFFLWKDAGQIEDVTAQPKEFFQTAVIKAISQKSANIYQNFKVIKVEPTKGEYKDQKYVIVDFKYDLLTGAGFEVQRRGVASVTNQGGLVQVLWTASTSVRFKKTEEKLRIIANSFRCYSDGLSLAVQSAANEKNYDAELD